MGRKMSRREIQMYWDTKEDTEAESVSDRVDGSTVIDSESK